MLLIKYFAIQLEDLALVDIDFWVEYGTERQKENPNSVDYKLTKKGKASEVHNGVSISACLTKVLRVANDLKSLGTITVANI